VVRHAHAPTCTIRLTPGETLSLEIIDDGKGLPSKYRKGVGLSSMHERATELGGTCDISSAPEAGTRVRVQLPLPR